MTSKEQALSQAVRHYVATMPIGLMLDLMCQDMMEHFTEHADEEEVEAFLLDFGPDNAPNGAH